MDEVDGNMNINSTKVKEYLINKAKECEEKINKRKKNQ